jgi:hypothetical protein
MKKKCAVFTMVKNENYFLPIWLKHYKKFFSNEDIFILDHQSNDGSTENLDVNVIPVINELAFDHQWLVNVVQDFQKHLLQEYESVLFAESDELVYSLDGDLNGLINHFSSDPNIEFLSCHSHEVIQDLENEIPISKTDEILKHRNNWFHWGMYDKTLLTKVPLHYEWGFHNTIGRPKNFKYDIFLLHLHRCDFELMLERHEERANKWKMKEDGGGGQHRISDREELLKWFNDVPSSIEPIPQNHKNALNGI